MKKYFCFLSLLFIVTSCTEDVKFNNPAFQTLKNNVFWRAKEYKAYLGENNTVIVEGSLGYDKVTLKTVSSEAKNYTLGGSNVSEAIYENLLTSEEASFSTAESGGNGQIVITEYDIENKTISGTFKFTAVNEDKSDTENLKVNFTEGVFYKVPIETSYINHAL